VRLVLRVARAGRRRKRGTCWSSAARIRPAFRSANGPTCAITERLGGAFGSQPVGYLAPLESRVPLGSNVGTRATAGASLAQPHRHRHDSLLGSKAIRPERAGLRLLHWRRLVKLSRQEMPGNAADVLTLPLTDIAHLFNAPAVDPTSIGVPEILGMAGVEYLLQQLEMVKGRGSTTLRLVLPRPRVISGMAEQSEAALRTYAEWRIEQLQLAVRATRRHGRRLTLVAVLLLAVFLGLSTIFASELTEGMRPLLRKTFEYGFEIVGWVMLWYPLEVLVFQPIALKTRISALRRVKALRVIVEEIR